MTSLSLFTFMHWRRKWQPTPVFLLGKSHGQRSLTGYNQYSSKRVRHYLATKQQRQRRQWHPTPVLLPGKSHGQKSLVGCSPWGRWSRTRLSDFTFTFHFHALEKEMATHSKCSCLENPRDGEPGGLLSMGSHRVGHN